MKMIKAALAGLSLLLAVDTAFAQSPPASMPFHTVYGRLGASAGDTGPGQPIPFALLLPNIFGPQSANQVYSGPSSGGVALPAFRTLVPADMAALLSSINTWTGAQSFTDGTLILLGLTSGSSTLKAPATGGGTATLFPGSDTIMGVATAQTPTNKTFNCANNTCTVRIANDVSGLGTGVATALGVNVGSAGAPVVNGGALGTPSSGTLTNATGLPYAGLASAAIATGAQYLAGTASELVQSGTIYQSEVAVTFGATTSFDLSTFINASVTLTGNITTMSVVNVLAGKAGTIAFIQDATGSRTTVWSTTFKFAGGTTPTLSTAANAVDILSYSCRSATFCVASLLKAVQ